MGVGRPGRTGTDATVLGIQGTDFWNVAVLAKRFRDAASSRTLTSTMAASIPTGCRPGEPRSLSLTVYSSGFDARIDVEVTDSTGRDVVLPMGTLAVAGWRPDERRSAARGAIAYPACTCPRPARDPDRQPWRR